MMRRQSFGLVLCLSSITTALSAQEATDVAELLSEDIVSTPSKGVEVASHAAATVSTVTAEDLRKFGIRSLDEALNFLAHGVVITDPAHAKESGARGVLLTGDYNNHFLLLLNGHPLNEVWDGSAYLDAGAGIPIELIDHIEVTLGPGSVMYGTEAMLGVINVVTRKANATRGIRTTTELELSAPVNRQGNPDFSGSFGRGMRTGLGYGRELTVFGKPAELVVAGEWRARLRPAFEVGPQQAIDPATLQPKDFGLRTPRGLWGGWLDHARMERAPSAYAQLSVGDFSLWLRAAEYFRQSAYIDSTLMNVGDFDDPRNFERDRWLNLDARQRFAVNRETTFYIRGFADHYRYDWSNASSATGDCPTELPGGCTQRLAALANSYGVELKGHVDWTRSGRFVTLIGAEARLRQVDSDSHYISGPNINRYDKLDLIEALYAEQKYVPLAELEFNLGMRIDHYPDFGIADSPRASLGVQPWQHAWWKTIYSTAFRAPTIYELNYRDTGQLQNPLLQPEKVWSIESSLEQRLGSQRVVFGVFYSHWEQLIQYAVLSNAELARAMADGGIDADAEFGYQYRNLATLRSMGLEWRVDGRLMSRLSYGVSATLARARFMTGDGGTESPLTVIPNAYGNARLAYELADTWPTIALSARFTNAPYADRAFDGGFATAPRVPARTDLKLAITGSIASVRGLSYQFGAGYSFARVGPYVIGPNLYATNRHTAAELSPVERLTFFSGLQFAPGQ